jgi:hypothetical protein
MPILLLLAVVLCLSQCLTASLQVLQYEPLVLQLSFSAPTAQPTFQLLYNNVYDIPYYFLSNQTFSDRFLIQADPQSIEPASNMQLFDLLFNNPLAVGDGSLELGSYSLQASQMAVRLDFPVALGVLLLLAAYLFNLFTEIGRKLVEFIHVYILFMFRSTMSTTIYRSLYLGLMMIPPQQLLEEQVPDPQSYLLLCLCLPLAVLWALAALGFAAKQQASKKRSVLGRVVYEEFVYGFFLKMSGIFDFNLLYNSIQFLRLLSNCD